MRRRPRLTGRPVMITGAASGIGRGLARRFSRLGSPVALADLDERGTGVSAVTVHPGGITTNIARNARMREDPQRRGRTRDQMAAEFEASTLTSPDKAAMVIHKGVEQGKGRILIGPDAYLFDTLSRITPTHCYAVLSRLEPLPRGRQSG